MSAAYLVGLSNPYISSIDQCNWPVHIGHDNLMAHGYILRAYIQLALLYATTDTMSAASKLAKKLAKNYITQEVWPVVERYCVLCVVYR